MASKTKITVEQRKAAETEILQQSRTVRYDTKDYTIGYLVSIFIPEKESLDADTPEEKGGTADAVILIPDYQRNSIWRNADRSLFIESILLGLPIPFLFFCERKDGVIEIVDGVQRMTTLLSFVTNQFKLSGLQKLSSLNGFSFSDLSDAMQKKFKNRSLRIIVLEGDTSLPFRQDLFSRVNRSGQKISPAEFRRGTFPGALTTFIENCSKEALFVKLCPLSDNKVARYARFELVLRFFAYVNNYKDVKQDVALFLDAYLLENQQAFDKDVFHAEFERMCNFVEKYFQNGFAKPDSIKAVPNVRFEAISVGVALALRENPALVPSDMSWLDSAEFKKTTTSDASNNPRRLQERVEFVKNSLLGVTANE
jgi:hypothetical protein